MLFSVFFFLRLLFQSIIICGAFETTGGFSKLFLCVVCFIAKCRVQYFAFTKYKVHVLLGCVYASSHVPGRYKSIFRKGENDSFCLIFPCQISLKIHPKRACSRSVQQIPEMCVLPDFKSTGKIPPTPQRPSWNIEMPLLKMLPVVTWKTRGSLVTGCSVNIRIIGQADEIPKPWPELELV